MEEREKTKAYSEIYWEAKKQSFDFGWAGINEIYKVNYDKLFSYEIRIKVLKEVMYYTQAIAIEKEYKQLVESLVLTPPSKGE